MTPQKNFSETIAKFHIRKILGVMWKRINVANFF